MKFIKKVFSRYYDIYENLKDQINSSETDDFIEDFINQIKGLIEKFIEKEIIDIKTEIETITEEDFINYFLIFLKALRNEEFRKELLETIIKVINNFEVFIQKTPQIIIDKSFYLNLREFIEGALSVETKKTLRCLFSYFKRINEKIPVLTVFGSLLINREKKWKEKELKRILSIEDFLNNSNSIETIIEEASETLFTQYVFDLALKFGYLLEAHIKNILTFILEINYIKKGLNFNVFKEESGNTIGDILHAFKEEDIYLNRIIKDYRNAIFHSDFYLKYDVDMEKREINIRTLIYSKERGKKVEKVYDIKIKDFFSYFYRMIILCFTVDVVIFSSFLKDYAIDKIINFFDTTIPEFLNTLEDISADDIQKLLEENK